MNRNYFVAGLLATIIVCYTTPSIAEDPIVSYGEQGVADGDFDGATGIDIDGEGRVYITDRQRNRVLNYTIDGEFGAESAFFYPGPPQVSFDQVTDVAIGDNDWLYLANEDDAQIVVLDGDFDIIGTFGTQCVAPEIPGVGCSDPDGAGPLAVGDGQFNGPAGIAFGLNNRIVVADTGNDRIQVFDANGNFILKFGSGGTAQGEFEIPSGVDVDPDGNIYVADTANDRVQVFDENGSFIREFGSMCNLETTSGCVDPDGGGPLELGDGQFNSARDLTVDYGGNVYVVDGFNNRIQIFDSNGDFVRKFSLPDDTANVSGIAVDALGRIHVTTSNASGTPSGVPFIVGVFEHDSDGDSLPDLWEVAGIDFDLDGNIDFDLTNAGTDYRGQTITADPNRKDIFVEIDYFDCGVAGGDCDAGDTSSHRPRDGALDLIVQAFNDAPVTPGDGINLWVQVDEALPHQNACNFDDGCFDTIKATNFGTSGEQNDPDILAGKALVFRYNLWVHDKEVGNSSSGVAEGKANETGNDFIVSLGTNWSGGVGTLDDQAGTFMHELGHTLGLGHGGGDNVNCKSNYLSVMNYLYTLTGLQPSGQFDFSRDALPTSGFLKEDALNETIGIQDGGFTTFYGPPDASGNLQVGNGFGSIDWDADGTPDDNPAEPKDINYIGVWGCGLDDDGVGEPSNNPTETLNGFVDWDIIKIGFRDSPNFADGQRSEPEIELDHETAEKLKELVWISQLDRIYKYAPKFICGVQEDLEEFRLTPGRYASVVNILNPGREIATFRKKLALAFPPKEQEAGRVYRISLDRLRPNEALKVDCEDVRENVFDGRFPTPYIEGFVTVESNHSLDVVGVYTTATLKEELGLPRHSDMEIERAPERIIELIDTSPLPDLIIDDSFDLNASCQGYGAIVKCEIRVGFGVRNIGNATADPFNVRIIRKLDGSILADVPEKENLSAGEVATLSAGFEVPVNQNEKDARVICLNADSPNNDVMEKNEDNNKRCLTF